MTSLILYLFLGIPLVSVVVFAINCKSFLAIKRQKEQNPESVSAEEFKSKKTWFKASAVVAGVLVTIVVGFIILLYSAIAFM